MILQWLYIALFHFLSPCSINFFSLLLFRLIWLLILLFKTLCLRIEKYFSMGAYSGQHGGIKYTLILASFMYFKVSFSEWNAQLSSLSPVSSFLISRLLFIISIIWLIYSTKLCALIVPSLIILYDSPVIDIVDMIESKTKN